MDKFIYELVKQNQAPLSAEEQYECAFYIRQSCDKILEVCYLHEQAREVILDTLDRTSNLSKLGRDYNSAILGHNKIIHDRIEALKTQLPKIGWLEGSVKLVKANLHPRLVLNENVLNVVKNGSDCWQKKRIAEELDVLHHNRTALVNCILNAAVEIAIQKHKQLNNEVIDVADLFQEAVKAAYDGTLLYNSDSKAKWSSFAYSRMYDVVSNFVADKSRIVAIPRSTIERFNAVTKAISATQSIDPLTLMDYANDLIHNEKALEYTLDEVETILKAMQGNVSLDFIIDDESERGHSLIDVLTLDNESDEPFNKVFLKKNIIDSLQRILNQFEFTVVDLLWGITTGEPKDFNTVFEEVVKLFPEKKISKSRVKKTIEKILTRLRHNSDLRAIWQEI
jgi:DNA-directed RNA polymerase sigma subunit (sigma70/sigma32)